MPVTPRGNVRQNVGPLARVPALCQRSAPLIRVRAECARECSGAEPSAFFFVFGTEREQRAERDLRRALFAKRRLLVTDLVSA